MATPSRRKPGQVDVFITQDDDQRVPDAAEIAASVDPFDRVPDGVGEIDPPPVPPPTESSWSSSSSSSSTFGGSSSSSSSHSHSLSSSASSISSSSSSQSYHCITSVPDMTGPAAPSGQAAASSEYTPTDRLAWKAFDQDESTYWRSEDGVTTPWLRYQFTSGIVALGYVLRFTIGAGTPSAWTFEGSNDGLSWTVLDTKTGQSPTAPGINRYTISNATSYSFYRINVSADDGMTGFIAIGEFGITECPAASSSSSSSSSSFSSSSSSSMTSYSSSSSSSRSSSSSSFSHSSSSYSSQSSTTHASGDIININLSNLSTFVGAMATGNSGDQWNYMTGTSQQSVINPLIDASGNSTAAKATLIFTTSPTSASHDGFTHPNEAYKRYFEVENAPDPAISHLIIEDLPAGTYDFYVYAHGKLQADSQIVQYILEPYTSYTAKVGGVTTTGADWNSATWLPGRQFVLFRETIVSDISIIVRDYTGTSRSEFNAVQIVKVA